MTWGIDRYVSIPCVECGVQPGEHCVDEDGETYGPLAHDHRRSLATVLDTHPWYVDPERIIRDESRLAGPEIPLWDCVAEIHSRWPGGIGRWLRDVDLVYGGVGTPWGYAGMPIWFPRQGGQL